MSDEQTIPSQVHVAAPTVMVGTLRRQRCAWCGALIDEVDLANVARPLEPGEDPAVPWEPAKWEFGAHVRVMGTGPRVSTLVEPEAHPADPGAFTIPYDSCMAVDPWATQ